LAELTVNADTSKQAMDETATAVCEFIAATIALVSPDTPRKIQFTQMWVSRTIILHSSVGFGPRSIKPSSPALLL
jgi:hypothetical protein